MRDKKIVIVSQSHLCRNPRVFKEALTLAAAGYAVVILTAIYSDALLKEDRRLIAGCAVQYEFYSDLRFGGINAVRQRLEKKLAIVLQSRFQLETIYSLGTGPRALVRRCKKLDADLYIMHQEMPTCIGGRLIKQGYRVAFDLEDWYAEDLLPSARAQRPLQLLRAAESFALQHGVYCTTTSQVLAGQLAQAYRSAAPRVIYNVFPSPKEPVTEQKYFSRPLKLFWFSQTIGPGRGLEEFIKLSGFMPTGIELHLLGKARDGYENLLTSLMPAQHSLYFHPLVPEPQLAAKIAEFDIGLALELAVPPSRNYTITNKFFQYIQSGLPVVASDTAGQREGFEKYALGFKLPADAREDTAAALERWLSDPAALERARHAAIHAAKHYNWENESKKLLHYINDAFEHTSQRPH
jgi:glycosyltransferase involved in cell wall biosynthesis